MSSVLGRVSKRYAQALFASSEPPKLPMLQAALASFAQIWAESAELREAMENPGVPPAQRIAALRDIAQAIRPGDTTFANFLSLLLENKRLQGVADISMTFKQMIDHLQHLLTLEITSAFPLAEQERSGVLQRIEQEYGSMASITWLVNPELIGGLQVKAGDRLLDDSISSVLERIQSQLAQ